MHSLEFNYLHDLATANYDLGNRPDPDSESIILKEDLLEAFWGAQTNEARVSAEKNYGCGPFRDIEVSSGGQTILLSVDYLGPSVYWLKDYYSEHGVDAPEADSRIRAFLKESRKLGGHILFPRGSNGARDVESSPQRGKGRLRQDRCDIAVPESILRLPRGLIDQFPTRCIGVYGGGVETFPRRRTVQKSGGEFDAHLRFSSILC